MSRVSNWEHAHGFEAGVALVSAKLQPFAETLAEMNLNVYTSDCFKSGLDQELLVKHARMASELMKVDARGGLFSQKLMCAALAAALSAAKTDAELVLRTLHTGKDKDEVLQLMAYRLRVLLSHYRVKFDNGSQDEELQAVFSHMDGGTNAVWTAKQARRAARLAKRPHPFKHYQGKSVDDDTESEEEARVISSYFNGSCAVLLKDDGVTMAADVYKPGPRGFVIAQWVAEGHQLELEIQNNLCVNGALDHRREPTSRVRKRPAACKEHEEEEEKEKEEEEEDEEKATEKEEEEDQEEEEKEETEESVMAFDASGSCDCSPASWSVADGTVYELKLVPGHKNSMTIVLRSSHSKDKAQICQVQGHGLASLKKKGTPRTVCVDIMRMITEDIKRLIVDGPVASSAHLAEIRNIARTARASMYVDE